MGVNNFTDILEFPNMSKHRSIYYYCYWRL